MKKEKWYVIGNFFLKTSKDIVYFYILVLLWNKLCCMVNKFKYIPGTNHIKQWG